MRWLSFLRISAMPQAQDFAALSKAAALVNPLKLGVLGMEDSVDECWWG